MIAPTFVWLLTSSSTTTRRAPRTSSASVGQRLAVERGEHAAVHVEAGDRAQQLARRRVDGHALGREAAEALDALREQKQRAHAVAEPQRALDHELALGDEDAVARAARPFGAQAQRGGAQVRVLAHAGVERVVEEHRSTVVGGPGASRTVRA